MFRVLQLLDRGVDFRVSNIVNNVVPGEASIFQVVHLPVVVRFVGNICRFFDEGVLLVHAAYASYAT